MKQKYFIFSKFDLHTYVNRCVFIQIKKKEIETHEDFFFTNAQVINGNVEWFPKIKLKKLNSIL